MKNSIYKAVGSAMGVVGILLILFVLVTTVSKAQEKPKDDKKAEVKPEDKKVPETLSNATLEPSKEFLDAFDEYFSLYRVVAEMKAEQGIDKLETKLQALGVKLGKLSPPGMGFNPQTRKYIKQVTPAPEPTPEQKK